MYVLVYCMKTFIQLNFKKGENLLTEKNHSNCSMYNFRNSVQGLLFRAFKFQPKWRKFARKHVTPPP